MKIDRLIRSRRKTLELQISSEGLLIVRAPIQVSLAQIEAFVIQKTGWIQRKRLEATRTRRFPATPQAITEGSEKLFLGQKYPVLLSSGQRPALHLKNNRFYLSAGTRHPQAVFSAWYGQEARRIFAERVALYAPQLGVAPRQIRLSNAHTRWGSCSTRGSINLVWRLVMAPLEIVDYVVVHELAHLKVPNHSKAFWRLVEGIFPDYKRRREWLKKNGQSLMV